MEGEEGGQLLVSAQGAAERQRNAARPAGQAAGARVLIWALHSAPVCPWEAPSPVGLSILLCYPGQSKRLQSFF